MIRGEDWYMLRELLREGLSVSEIARRTGHDRKTIRKVRADTGHPVARPRPKRGSKLDPFKPYLQERVALGVLNAAKLYDEVRQQGYRGSLTLLRLFLRPLRPVAPLVTERFETPPGQQAQVDWASCGQLWHQGRWRRLSAFVVTLGYSRRCYVEFTLSQDLDTFLGCHVAAFGYFGGVPAELLYDNLKTAVDHRLATGEVVWNGRLRDLADYYGFVPRACAPYRARTKGKVETSVRYLKGNFLLGLDPGALSLEDLNQQVRRWLRETADVRRHGTTGERPMDRWPAEAAALRALGERPAYDTSRVCQRLVSTEGFVAYQGSRYAVPPEHAGRLLLLRDGGDGRLRVFLGADGVVEHDLAPQPGSVVLLPGHAEAVRRLARTGGRGARGRGGGSPAAHSERVWPVVAVRPLAAYDAALGLGPLGGERWTP